MRLPRKPKRNSDCHRDEIKAYLTENIAFRMDEEMKKGLKLYFELALKHKLIAVAKPLEFT